MKVALFAPLLLLASACADVPTQQTPAEIAIRLKGNECVTEFAGDTYSDQNELIRELRKAQVSRVRILSTTEVPYKCVGGMIFELQHSRIEVAFVAEPPPK